MASDKRVTNHPSIFPSFGICNPEVIEPTFGLQIRKSLDFKWKKLGPETSSE